MELLSHLNTLDMVPDGSTRKLPTLATTSAAGIVKPDGTSITVNEDGEISSPFKRVIKDAYFSETTAEFIRTDCTWQDVLDAQDGGYELLIMGHLGNSDLWFFEEAVSTISGYERALFRGNTVIGGYLITLTITIPQSGTASCLTIYNEKVSEKVSTWSATTNNNNYPSEKLVKDSLDEKATVTALTAETTARTTQYQELEERVDRLEGSLQYYLLELYEDTYIDPTTLQPVSGRTYEDDDFATDQLGDINLKAWLKYNYELHDYEDLNTASINVTGFEIGYDKLWEYWTNLTNPLIPSYPDLQQIGQYRNEGTGAFSDFTDTVHGGIVGYQSDGYVCSAGSGKGQVYGWDTLTGRVTALETGFPDPATATPLASTDSGAVGTSVKYAREDHIHPRDTSREAVANKITAWSETASDSYYPSEKLVKGSFETEIAARQAGDTALGNRITSLETFNTTTLPNTYATIAALNTTNQNVSANTSSITALGNRVTTNEGEITDIWDKIDEITDPTNPESIESKVANILEAAPEDLNTFLEVYEEFQSQGSTISSLQSDVNEAATVKSYNYTTSTPDTYLIKVQSGTSGLTTDTNTLTFCY